MARFRIEVDSPAGAAEVFNYLSDFASVAEWNPGVLEAHLLNGTTGTTGATYEVVAPVLGRSLTLEYSVLEAVAPTDRFAGHVVLEAVTDEMRSLVTIAVRPGPAGCTVTYDTDLALLGARRPLDPLLRMASGIVGERTRTALAAAVQLRPTV